MHYLTNYYKNLCEQLQEKINHLQKLVETSERSLGAQETHDAIVNAIVDEHVKVFPHLRLGTQGDFNTRRSRPERAKVSEQHMREILNNHPQAPFVNIARAVDAMVEAGGLDSPTLTTALHDRFGSGEGTPARTEDLQDDYTNDLITHIEGKILGPSVGRSNASANIQSVRKYAYDNLKESSSGYPGDKVTSRKISRDEQEAINSAHLEKINAQRIAMGQQPFETFDELVQHNIATNAAFRAQKEQEQRARVEAWRQTPEGRAHIAMHTPPFGQG